MARNTAEPSGNSARATAELLILDGQDAERVARERYDLAPGEELSVTVPLPGETQ